MTSRAIERIDSSVSSSSGYIGAPSGSFFIMAEIRVSIFLPVCAEIFTTGRFSSKRVLYESRFCSLFTISLILSTLFKTIITGVLVPAKRFCTIHLSPAPAGSDPSTIKRITSASGMENFASSSKNSPSLSSGLWIPGVSIKTI